MLVGVILGVEILTMTAWGQEIAVIECLTLISSRELDCDLSHAKTSRGLDLPSA